jgi:hypothetical protein
VVFYCGAHHLSPNATYSNLCTATFALLTYSYQKNVVHGKTVGHGHTGHPYFGPVQSLAHWVEHL